MSVLRGQANTGACGSAEAIGLHLLSESLDLLNLLGEKLSEAVLEGLYGARQLASIHPISILFFLSNPVFLELRGPEQKPRCFLPEPWRSSSGWR